MLEQMEYPVLVVGAGPTGLLLAALLGNAGVEVLLVDKNSSVSPHPKAILLDDEALRSLQVLGLSDIVSENCLMGYGAHYYNEEGVCFASIEPQEEEYGYPKRNSFLQPELEKALEECVSSLSNVTFLRSCEFLSFSEDGKTVTTELKKNGEKFQVQSRLLVGCDGGKSSVRQALGLYLKGFGYDADWVVLDTEKDLDNSHFTRFICDPKRAFVSIPAPKGGRRYEFKMLEGETKEQVLDFSFICRVLKPYRKSLKKEDLTRAAVYRFSACVAEKFQKGRVFLAGDSCHLTPPFAGQGMNTGLRDAHNLAWKIERYLKGISSFSLLKTYEKERLEKVQEMVQFAVSLGEIVMPKTELESKVMSTIWKLASLAPEVKDYITKMKFKPKPYYEKGAFLFRGAKEKSSWSAVGKMLPQPRVFDKEGKKTLLDSFLGEGFSLVALGKENYEVLEKFSHTAFKKLTKVLVLSEEEDLLENLPSQITSVFLREEDSCESFSKFFYGKNSFYLVRPDRYVFLEGSTPKEFEDQFEYISTFLS